MEFSVEHIARKMANQLVGSFPLNALGPELLTLTGVRVCLSCLSASVRATNNFNILTYLHRMFENN